MIVIKEHLENTLTGKDGPYKGLLLFALLSAFLPSCSKKSSGGGGAVPPAAVEVEDDAALNEGACGDLAENQSITRTKYQSSSVSHGNSCISEVQTSTCIAGKMSSYSGSYTFDSCVVNSPTAPQINLKHIILEAGGSLSINLADIQSGAPSDDGIYYHSCYFDETIDGSVALSNNCDDFSFFSYDFLYSGNGEADFTYHSSYTPGSYEFYVKSESQWGTTDSYIPALIKEPYKGGSSLALDLDARFGKISTMGPQSAQGSWSNIAASGSGNSIPLQGSFSDPWVGNGINVQSPYALQFDGNSGLNAAHLRLGKQWNSLESQSYSMWVYGESHNDDGTLLANKGSDEGFVLSFTEEGYISLTVSGDTGIPEYSSVILADTPIAYWPLSQTSGNTVVNLGSSGSGLNATYDIGQANFSSDSALRNQYSQEITSQDHRLQVAAHPDLFDFSSNGISIELWAKSNSERWNSNNNFISKRNQFIFGSIQGDSRVRFYVHDGNGWQSLTSPYLERIEEWHHYSATFDGTTMKIYVDGIEVASSTNASAIATSNSSLSIGTDYLNDTPVDGKLQSLAIYNYALSDAQILNHASSGLINQNSCVSSHIVTDRWVNPVISFATGSAKLYLNGELSCEINLAEIGKSHTGGTGELTVGANLFGGFAFKGKVGALRVYTETLDPQTIQDDFFTTAPQYLEIPETIPGLVAWYDASHAESITTNAGQVTQWQDRSWNMRHLVEENPGAGAITQNIAASPTGLNTVHFDGTNNSYLGNYNSVTTASAFGVFRYDAGPNFTEYDAIYTCSNNTPLAGTNTNNRLYSNWGNRFINGSNTTIIGDIQTFNQASTITTVDPTVTAYHRIGTFTTTTNRVWHGDIAEVIVYNRALSYSERIALEAYQKEKWGTP